jgi:hypothetical protein
MKEIISAIIELIPLGIVLGLYVQIKMERYRFRAKLKNTINQLGAEIHKLKNIKCPTCYIMQTECRSCLEEKFI